MSQIIVYSLFEFWRILDGLMTVLFGKTNDQLPNYILIKTKNGKVIDSDICQAVNRHLGLKRNLVDIKMLVLIILNRIMLKRWVIIWTRNGHLKVFRDFTITKDFMMKLKMCEPYWMDLERPLVRKIQELIAIRGRHPMETP